MLHALVRVVSPTSQGQILDTRLASRRIRNDMVELEESGLVAPTVRADERALSGIALPHEAADIRGHSARVGNGTDGGPRRGGLRQTPSLELIDEDRQGSFDNCRRIAGRQSMTQQVLSPSELLVRLSADRDLDQVPLWRERRDHGARKLSRNG
jgi:hypothetical protein